MKDQYFTVRHDLIVSEKPLPYDLYVNSSALKERQKFIKIFSFGGVLTKEDISEFYGKYHHLYISEKQRKNYLKSLVDSSISDVQKTQVIKDKALEYLHNIFDHKKDFSTEVLAENINSCRDVVESMVDVLDGKNIDSLRSLIGDLSFHDFYTYDHSINVSMYCIQIYRAIHPKASRNQLMHAGLGGLLHDLGKIKIPTSVLNKPAGLSDDEFQLIKSHPELGLELLMSDLPHVSEDIDLKIIARIIHEHHENYDGTGYPRKLKGKEEIHLLARVCMIADFFDAITTKRSYNEVLTIENAMKLMEKTKSQKVDPDIFDEFAKQVSFVKSDYQKNLKLTEKFDPSIPFAELPLIEEKDQDKIKNFGKIKISH